MAGGGWDDYAADFGYPATADASAALASSKAKILLMGPRRSGKTSIEEVVFRKISPHETLFLNSTQSLDVLMVANNPYIQFQIWDFAGDYSLEEEILYGGVLVSPDLILSNCAAIVFVLDAQESSLETGIAEFVKIVRRARAADPDIIFEVLIHKVDGDLFFSEDQRIDRQREAQSRIQEELDDPELNKLITYHLTSIYDHSIFQAFSRIVQKIISEIHILEDLLNILISNCEMEKVFLFDVISKLYLASDSGPVETQSIELCGDMIDVAIDMSSIYGLEGNEADPVTFDDQSSTCIRLDNGIILYLRQVSNYLALVCQIRHENFLKKGIIDYNINCFKEALWKIFAPGIERENAAAARGLPAAPGRAR